MSVLLNEPSDEQRPDPDWLTEDQVGFPFPSNPAQRRVADAIEKNDVVVVQGPPGTGKSLTIANLVAHLVMQGKSVLVSSHKQQALTVVRDKLNETNLEFLYASLIGDTGQAKRQLQSQITGVRAFAGQADSRRLKKQLDEIEKRRAESGARFAAVRDEYISRAEPEQVEAAGIYAQIEPHPLLPVGDPAVVEKNIESVAQGLRALDEMARRHRSVWKQLTSSKLAGSSGIETVAGLLRRFLDHQHARVRAATDEEIKSLVQQWHPVFHATPGQIRKAREAIVGIEAELYEPFLEVVEGDAAETELASARALVRSPDLLADAHRSAARVKECFHRARELADARTAVSSDPVRRADIVMHHATLGSLVRRRGAKKWLDQYAPGAVGLTDEQVERWRSFWDNWKALQTEASGLGGALRAELPDTYDPDAAAALIARMTRVVALADAIRASESAARGTRVSLPVGQLVETRTAHGFRTMLNNWATAVSAAEADSEGNKLIASGDAQLIRQQLTDVDDLLDAGRADEAAGHLEQLETIWRSLPELAERRDLLAGPTGKLKGAVKLVENAATANDDPPAFIGQVERALALQPLVKRFAEVAAERSTNDLATELEELQMQVLEDARRLLGLRIQSRILDRDRNPKFQASVEIFKRAVGTSAKRHERFEELKNSPSFDVDVLTDVFPCWIMRPEDVCRIFPLRAGIFDVVIFDEASQCNPDQALPLFARAGKVAIFGDRNQLSNEDLRRSLSAAANKALLRQSGLSPLDSTGVFDQTRNSLLDLVSQRQQAAVLLNEHFRCRPEIVAFSNERFYGNTLTIIRDRWDDRGTGPAILIRRVMNVDGTSGSKVNYAEARAVVDELVRRLGDPRYREMTFGVLSLFREQIEHIQMLVEREVDRGLLDRHRVICSTVDGFQGDERDVILYSWRFAKGTSPSIFAFTNGEGGSQRVNVALTRARHQTIHFISASVDEFPVGAGNVSPYLKHGVDPERLLTALESRAHRTPGGEARQRVAAALNDAGFEVQEDFVACGAAIDLLVISPGGARVAVFVDAEVDPHPPVNALHRVDVHSLLRRAGWRIVRIPAATALPSPQRAVGLVSAAVEGVELSDRGKFSEQAYATVDVDRQSIKDWVDGLAPLDDIAPEDLADYHWEVGSVDARLHAGDAVFMSDFERELYDRIAAVDGINCVPQWPSRGKFIDIVITDSDGRRLAIEADGEQHHETSGGELIPEDIERQAFLEDAGWVFHRIRHKDFHADPGGEIGRLVARLREQPTNQALAVRLRGEHIAEEVVGPVVGLPIPESTERLEPQPSQDAGPVEATPAAMAASATRDRQHTPDETTVVSVPDPAVDSERRSATPLAEGEREAGPAPATLADFPLSHLAERIGQLVTARDSILDDELVDSFTAATGVEVPTNLRSLLTKFAWSAKGHGFVELDGGRWIPGDASPHPITGFGDWTFSAAVERAATLLRGMPEKHAFESLVGEIYETSGRRPRLAATVAGKAIWQAQRGGQLTL